MTPAQRAAIARRQAMHGTETRKAADLLNEPHNKFEHVREARQTRPHVCHWPGCYKQVPPAFWGCRDHWFLLPIWIRNLIWKHYRAGQEERLDPSPEYLRAADTAQQWIEKHYPRAGKVETP